MWSYPAGSPPNTAPLRWRSLRKNGKLPHRKVVRLAVTAGGRLLWTSGKSTLSLWDAYSEWTWRQGCRVRAVALSSLTHLNVVRRQRVAGMAWMSCMLAMV